jgi:hypothetical protein
MTILLKPEGSLPFSQVRGSGPSPDSVLSVHVLALVTSRFILILSVYLLLGLICALFSSGCPIKAHTHSSSLYVFHMILQSYMPLFDSFNE